MVLNKFKIGFNPFKTTKLRENPMWGIIIDEMYNQDNLTINKLEEIDIPEKEFNNIMDNLEKRSLIESKNNSYILTKSGIELAQERRIGKNQINGQIAILSITVVLAISQIANYLFENTFIKSVILIGLLLFLVIYGREEKLFKKSP